MSFPRYPTYKDSGVEWLGEVPKHWVIQPLKHIAKLQTGTTPSTEDQDNFSNECGYQWIRPEDIDETGKASKSSKLLSEQGWERVRRIRAGASLICCIGSIGKVGYVADVVSTNQQITAAEPVDDARYLFHSIRAARSELDLSSSGNVIRILNTERLGAVRFARPPLPEQAQIATFLDHETAKIDALITEQQRLIELLQEKRQAVISHAVTKGLNPDAPMKDSGVEWLGEVPEHWTLKRLKHLSPNLTVGIVVNPSEYVSDEGLPFVYGGDIREGVIDWENSRRIAPALSDKQPKTRLRSGDLLMVRVGAPGITAVVPAQCEGGNCASVMLIRQGSFSSQWLCFTLNTRIVRFQVEVVQYGAAQEQFNISHAVNFWLPVPPRQEQDRIAAFLDSEHDKAKGFINQAQSAVSLLQERRSALISAAVTGQIDVRGLVPEARTT
jgi:type I restriction enzyme S subunit